MGDKVVNMDVSSECGRLECKSSLGSDVPGRVFLSRGCFCSSIPLVAPASSRAHHPCHFLLPLRPPRHEHHHHRSHGLRHQRMRPRYHSYRRASVPEQPLIFTFNFRKSEPQLYNGVGLLVAFGVAHRERYVKRKFVLRPVKMSSFKFQSAASSVCKVRA